MAVAESSDVSCSSWREVSRSGRPEHIHPIVNPLLSSHSKRLYSIKSKQLAKQNKCLYGLRQYSPTKGNWNDPLANLSPNISQTSAESSVSPTLLKAPSAQRIRSVTEKNCVLNPSSKTLCSSVKDITLTGATVYTSIVSPQSPSLRMDWEDFQNLEHWVNATQLTAHTMDATLLGVDESFANGVPQNEQVVHEVNNTSTPLSSILEESIDDGLWSPMEKFTNGGSPTILDNNRQSTTTAAMTLINTTPTQMFYQTSDDLMLPNELSIIDDNLVKGIINSTTTSNNNTTKTLDDIYDDLNEQSIVFSNNLDVDNNANNTFWNKIGLKSSDSNVMFSSAPQQVYQTTPSQPTSTTSLRAKTEYDTSVTYSPLSSRSSNSSNTNISAERSNSPIIIQTVTPSKTQQRLNLNLLIPVTQEKEIIDTPDVINTVLALKKDEFDLLTYINDDTVASTFNDISQVISKNQQSSTTHIKTQKRSNSSNMTQNNDDVFGSKKQKITYDNNIPVARRGRPPKSRTNSISSDDTDSSKYRELRDKNNEASRRSRINRKLREANMEQEAKELEKENIRLTARVKELDQLVSRMRQALLNTVLSANRS